MFTLIKQLLAHIDAYIEVSDKSALAPFKEAGTAEWSARTIHPFTPLYVYFHIDLAMPHANLDVDCIENANIVDK